jgi:CubicO group peptidase (beta-lactamase class C family)
MCRILLALNFLFYFVSLSGSPLAGAPLSAAPLDSPLDQAVQAHLAEKNFQGAVLIAKEGKILFSQGFGFANAEHLVFNTPKTVFRLGSTNRENISAVNLQEELALLTRFALSSSFAPSCWRL